MLCNHGLNLFFTFRIMCRCLKVQYVPLVLYWLCQILVLSFILQIFICTVPTSTYFIRLIFLTRLANCIAAIVPHNKCIIVIGLYIVITNVLY